MKWFRRQRAADQVTGLLGYHGLATWWVNTFTAEERELIESTYKPFGWGRERPLTTGDIRSTTATAADTLYGLAGWFNKPGHRPLARRILAKADELASEPLDKHFMLQQMIEVNYADRDSEPDALDAAIHACERQIELAPKAAKAFRATYPKSPLPSHVGYTQLAIIREKAGDYPVAITLSRKALRQGWAGGREQRIARCERKLNKNL
jgi:tetratricopeptide (TPR) repeat protein